MAAPRSVTSFKKVSKDVRPSISGTKPCPQNFSLLVSSGVLALDSILGGGLPVGSLLLIEEDTFGYYSNVICQCFLAEGVLSQHRLFVASRDIVIDQLLENLPSSNDGGEKEDDISNKGNDMAMKIAWRYQKMKLADTTIDEKMSFGHKLNLSKKIPKTNLNTDDITCWPSNRSTVTRNENFTNYLGDCLKESRHQLDNSEDGKQIMRVAAIKLGSALWDPSQIAGILYNLRSKLRQTLSVGLVTIPSYLYQDPSLISRWTHFADICIRLDSFVGTEYERDPNFKDFHGFLHIKKLIAFNSLVPHPALADLAFKLRRRKLVIERFCLPPELEDTTARGNQEKNIPSCAGISNRKLDF